MSESEINQAPGGTSPSSTQLSVSWPATLVYALPAAPLSFMGALAGMYLLKFASDVLLIAPAVFSLLFAVSKVFDAFSDPIAGYASDRTRLSFGRRRPWLLAAVLPMCATFWAVWNPPAFADSGALVVWTGTAIVLYYLAYTIAYVPHLALGAELSSNHHERTRIFGARAAGDIIGMGAAAGAMFWLQTAQDPHAVARTIALLFSLSTLILLPLTAARTRERAEFQGRPTPRPLRAMRDVASNPHARILLGALVIDSSSFTLMGVLFPFIAAYALPDGSSSSSLFVGMAIALAVVMFPLWPALARRYGKRNAWLIALCMRTVGFALILLAWGEAWMWAVTLVLIGGSLSATFIIPPSIKSDVIDYDELLTGDRKEGSYFAAWNLAQKLASGAAITIAGMALQASGYEANAEQGETAKDAMITLFAGVPLVLHVIAALLLTRLGLDEDEHARIRAEIDRRQTQEEGEAAHSGPLGSTKR